MKAILTITKNGTIREVFSIAEEDRFTALGAEGILYSPVYPDDKNWVKAKSRLVNGLKAINEAENLGYEFMLYSMIPFELAGHRDGGHNPKLPEWVYKALIKEHLWTQWNVRAAYQMSWIPFETPAMEVLSGQKKLKNNESIALAFASEHNTN